MQCVFDCESDTAKCVSHYRFGCTAEFPFYWLQIHSRLAPNCLSHSNSNFRKNGTAFADSFVEYTFVRTYVKKRT